MRSIESMRATVVRTGKSAHRFGKVKHVVFHPVEKRVVGFIVKRRDVALMVARADRFLGFGAFEEIDGCLYVAPDAEDAFDEAACKRLEIDYDICCIWKDLPIVTESGYEIGKVGDVEYDESTGDVIRVFAYDSKVSKAVNGKMEIPSSLVIGVREIKLVVLDEADDIEYGEGLAFKAGQAAQVATTAAKVTGARIAEKAPEAKKKVEKAASKGAKKTVEQIGKTKGMFAAFKEEYEKSLHGDD